VVGVVDDVGQFFLSSWSELPLVSEVSGFAITDDFIIRGSSGLRDYLRNSHSLDLVREGRFIGIFFIRDQWRIRTDIAGQELAYLYRNGSSWAVSNSLLRLAREVRKAQLPLSLNVHQLAVSPSGGYGSQPLTSSTIYAEISLLLPSDEIVLDAETMTASIDKQNYVSALDALYGADVSYEQAIEDFLADALATTSGLLNKPETFVVDLSGGYDSRFSASLFHHVSPGFDGVFLRSDETQIGENRIASEVMGALGYRKPLHKPPTSRLPTDLVFSYWLDASAGGYLPIRAVMKQVSEPFTRVTGDLSSSPKYSRFPPIINGLVGAGSRGQTSGTTRWLRDVRQLMADMGRGGRSSRAVFYGLTRSRFHCGRDWYRRFTRQVFYTPLASARLTHLYVLAARERRDPKLVLADLQARVNPSVMKIPHAESRRQWPKAVVDSRLRTSTRAHEIKAKTVFGNIHAPVAQPSASASELPFRHHVLESFESTVADLNQLDFPKVMLDRARHEAELAQKGEKLVLLKYLSRAVQLGELLRYAN
jgi:hypothetical protein